MREATSLLSLLAGAALATAGCSTTIVPTSSPPQVAPTQLPSADLAPPASPSLVACLSTIGVTMTEASPDALAKVSVSRTTAEAVAMNSPGINTPRGVIRWTGVAAVNLGWFSIHPWHARATDPRLAYLVRVTGQPIMDFPTIDRAIVPVDATTGIAEPSLNVSWDSQCGPIVFAHQ